MDIKVVNNLYIKDPLPPFLKKFPYFILLKPILLNLINLIKCQKKTII